LATPKRNRTQSGKIQLMGTHLWLARLITAMGHNLCYRPSNVKSTI
jgi:hypothetical protein